MFASIAVLSGTAPLAQTQAANKQEPSTKVLRFEAATIKPSDPKNFGYRLEFTVDGFLAKSATLRDLTTDAYDAYEPGRLLGGPAWFDKDGFDLQAKLNTDEVPEFKDLSLQERRSMVQKLLEDRFKLVIHHEKRPLPMLVLTTAKGGPKLHATDESNAFHGSVKGMNCLITRSRPGELAGTHCSATDISNVLQGSTRQMVQNGTGLTGFYDFDLHWTPEGAPPGEDAWPSLYAAVRQQLGLELRPTRQPVDVIVVDSADRPSEN